MTVFKHSQWEHCPAPRSDTKPLCPPQLVPSIYRLKYIFMLLILHATLAKTKTSDDFLIAETQVSKIKTGFSLSFHNFMDLCNSKIIFHPKQCFKKLRSYWSLASNGKALLFPLPQFYLIPQHGMGNLHGLNRFCLTMQMIPGKESLPSAKCFWLMFIHKISSKKPVLASDW